MADPQTVIEGTLKYRDNKKWKPRWCVIRKLSPVADCLHLQLYRDSKDRCKNGPTKASLSLEGFLGMETGFTLDKESNTMALICSEVVVVLAFDSRELLIQWQVKVRANLLEEHQFLVQIAHVPARSKLASGPARLHLLDYMFCLTAGVPPKLLGIWPLKELRRFGVVDGKFCFEGGSRCNKGEGLHVLLTNQAKDLVQAFDMASRGRLPGRRKMSVRKTTGSTDGSTRSSLQSRPPGCCNTTNDDKIPITCSTESTAKHLLHTDGCELGMSRKDKENSTPYESHIRPCHMHYRWPSCIVPCGTGTRDITGDENQPRPIARTSVGPQGQMLWAVGHCQGCSVHYCRRSNNDKEKTTLPTDTRFGDDSSNFTPQWTMDLNVMSPSKENANTVNTRNTNRNRGKAPHDRSSLCSQSSQSSGTSTGSNASSSSSSSSISEYSVPKNCIEGYYDRPKNIHHPVHPYNRLSHPEDNSKTDPTTPSGLRSNLGPIQESGAIPPCTCWNQRPEQQQQPQDVMFVGNDLLCTCWNRGQRNSADMDMPSFSSSGSSNVSPSTSPKKQPTFVGVPILLPCTCGKSNNNPYLNYAVPRSAALAKEVKDGCKESIMCRNITEFDSSTGSQEIKIINKIDNTASGAENLEDNGNKLSSVGSKPLEVTSKPTNLTQQQVCPCQRLLLCPPSFLPPSWNRSMQPGPEERQRMNNQTNAEYASVNKRPTGCVPAHPSGGSNLSDNENQKRKDEQNLNFLCRQNPWACNLPADCCSSKMSVGVPVMNSWKKDNANHIYVNLKYLQETAAVAAANTQGAPKKLIPYYANLYFLQTLSLYENAGFLAMRTSNLFPGSDPTGSGGKVDDASKTDELKKTSVQKKRMELPSNNGVYEMMSFNRDESPSASSDNYMLMQPGLHYEIETVPDKVGLISETSVDTEKEPIFPNLTDGASFESTSLPLRPFMPVLLPFHEQICDHKDDISEDDVEKHLVVRKCCSQDGHCRSSRSNSLGDLKMTVLKRGRSSSTDGRQNSGEKGKDDCNATTFCSSPKNTPIRKHPILTKLSFRSKEKSFSTDEITPPSTAPSSPDSLFLESIQKYPFHRSADCLQLNEEYRLSEEDLSQDPEVIMSQSMDKGRSTLSIKRSSSVPCKGNAAQQSQSSSGNDNAASSTAQSMGQAAIFSHFIAYHGSLPRRCSGNAASRHPLIDRKKASTTSATTQDQLLNQTQEQRSHSDPSNLIFISECKQCHQFVTSPEGLLVLDAKSMTSSSSSDMSDYIESLSLCSRSSSGSGSSGVGGISGSEYIRTEEISKLTTSCTSSLRPRSGKEYHSFDRVVFQDGCPYIPVADCSHLTLPCLKPFLDDSGQILDPTLRQDRTGDVKSYKTSTSSTTKTNSPSPGYVSSSPGNLDFASPEKTPHFSFQKETKDLNYLEIVSVNESEPTSPVVKSGMVQYAVIDVVATVAAKKLSAERAQLREEASPTPTHSQSSKHTTDDKEK